MLKGTSGVSINLDRARMPAHEPPALGWNLIRHGVAIIRCPPRRAGCQWPYTGAMRRRQGVDVVAKSFGAPESVNELPSGKARGEVVSVEGGIIVRVIMQPGFRWSNDIKPLAGGEACTMRHLGTVLEGTYHFEFADGTEFDVGPGGVYDVPAGRPHDEWVVGHTLCRAIDIHLEAEDG